MEAIQQWLEATQKKNEETFNLIAQTMQGIEGRLGSLEKRFGGI
jgi:hypothetical protein